MSESFNLEIVNPEKLFLSLDNVSEVVVPAFEGDMGILKDHISIISFLKPGIIKVFSGLIISIVKFSSIKQLHLSPFFLLFQLPLQLYPPCKRHFPVNGRTPLCK